MANYVCMYVKYSHFDAVKEIKRQAKETFSNQNKNERKGFLSTIVYRLFICLKTTIKDRNSYWNKIFRIKNLKDALKYGHLQQHSWSLQPFSQDYGLASHTTHVVYVSLIREWRDLQCNVDSERQIFEKLFHGRFIYSQSFCKKSAERKSPKKYFSYFIFDDWPGIWTQAFASKKPTHYILDRLHRQFNEL